MSTFLIRGGILVDPALGPRLKADLLIRDGRIESIGPGIPAPGASLDARGWFVCPGFVDMHVHLREPGFEYKETIASGLLAAVRGGFTAVAPMPNTTPVCDCPEVGRFLLDQARQAGLAEVHPIAAITRGSRGDTLVDFRSLSGAGCRVFSNDGQPVTEAGTMRRAMQAVREIGGVIDDHCEDKSLAAGGVLHPSPQAAAWGVAGLTPLAEEVHVARDLLLAEETGCPLHLAHLSTARGVDLVRWAKGRGAPVTAEATPHHLTLTVADIPGANPDFKMNPPLRTAVDRAALQAAVADGTIDAIATDHAPHAAEEKAPGLADAPFGIVGLETAVPLIMESLYQSGRLTMEQIVLACAVRPARILGAAPRTLAPGSAANLTLIDPDRTTVVDRREFASRSTNTPFEGRHLRGAVSATFVDGRPVFLQDR